MQAQGNCSPCHSASMAVLTTFRNVDKSARNHALWFAQASSASKLHLSPKSLSSLNASALVAVFVPRNALSAQSTSSIYLPTLRPKLRIDTQPTASNFIDCRRPGLDKFLGWWGQTVLERAQHSRYSAESSNPTLADMIAHLTGRRS